MGERAGRREEVGRAYYHKIKVFRASFSCTRPVRRRCSGEGVSVPECSRHERVL